MLNRRHHTYKLIINDLPAVSIYLAFLIFFAVVSGSILTIFFAPSVNDYQRIKFKTPEVKNALLNNGELVAEAADLNKMNQELSFSLYLKGTKFAAGLKKTDLKLTVVLEGRMTRTGEPTILYHANVEHVRTLECSNLNTDDYFCSPIVVFRERFITHNFYTVKVKLDNIAPLQQHNLLENVIEGQFDYTNPKYTIFESMLRAQFFSLSMILLVFYCWFLFSRQSWSYCKTEQRMIVVLLFALIWYNNPLFIADWLADNWFFPLLNIIFIATFASLLLFFVMVITHAAVKKVKERTFWFYAPKAFVVALNWLFVIITLTWERLNQRTDPAYDMTEIPFFGGIRVAVITTLIVIVGMLVFYVFRALGEFSKMGITYEIRFKYFWVLTLLVILATTVDFGTMLLVDYANNAAQYLSFFPLYNFYCVTLAIFYLPSNTVEDDSHEVIASSLKFDDDDDDFGTSNSNKKRGGKRTVTKKAQRVNAAEMKDVVDIDLGNIEDDVVVKAAQQQQAPTSPIVSVANVTAALPQELPQPSANNDNLLM